MTGANAGTLTEDWSVATPYVGRPLVRGHRIDLGGTRPVGTSQVTGDDTLAPADGSPVWSRDLVTAPSSIALPLGPTFSAPQRPVVTQASR